MSEENNTGTLLKILKSRQFRHGDDFSQFCSRFLQYVDLSKIKDENLNLIFLSMLDDRTYTKLAGIEIENDDAKSAVKFCKIYEHAYYPSDNTANIASDLIAMSQEIYEKLTILLTELKKNLLD